MEATLALNGHRKQNGRAHRRAHRDRAWHPPWRRALTLVAAIGPLVTGLAMLTVPTPAAATPCQAPLTPVACENRLPGNPSSEWEISGIGDSSIVGFSTEMSVNVGTTVRFKVNTVASAYTMDVYRMGYYGGKGARKVTSITPSAPANNQPACLSDQAVGNVDCGNWHVTASWNVPAAAVSGIYFVKLRRTDTGGNNHIVFVVRNDASSSAMIFQTSDTTWQAYNSWGGNSFYKGAPVGRAFKISYNRPFNTRGTVPDGRDFVWANEYPMVRWLERNGYDVAYQAGLDTSRSGSLLKKHKVFLSVGHDEYWDEQQRLNVEAARDAGVHLAFFSGNEVYWKTRWEPSIDGAKTPNRTYVTYKETRANNKIDPSPEWTGTWRDPRLSPPADGGRPENALTGTMYAVNCCNKALKVPAADGKMRLWRNTTVANQSPGQVASVSPNIIGYEFDITPDNGHQPPGLVKTSTTPGPVAQLLTDYGMNVVAGEATHHTTLYRAPSGALVFGAGTVQWSWGLDEVHDGTGNPPQSVPMQQATLNLFADMGVQPSTRQTNLKAATASTDRTGPSVAITSPAAGATVTGLTTVNIAGTATDAGGGVVGGVEVSTDNGTTWHPATGRSPWSYSWTVTGSGPATIRVRAADDSGNIGAVAARNVTARCPCSIFGAKAPFTSTQADTGAVTLGVKFRSDVAGWVTGVRFYKGAGNTGTHIGSLWSTSGTRLAQATFANETETGWQQVSFAKPVAIQANTTYVASYFAPNGRYAGERNFFNGKGVDAPPLHALASAASGGNGVFRGGDQYPPQTSNATDYGVDVVFTTTAPTDGGAPTATVTPPAGAGSVPVTTTVRVAFDEPVQAATVTVALQAGTTNVPGSTTYDLPTSTAVFTPSAPLAAGTPHNVRVSGARDLSGNQMATVTSTFTTAKTSVPGACPCHLWSDGTVPAVAATTDTGSVELGLRFRSAVKGNVTGVRFYKGPGNSGTHTGTLWSATGTPLAQVTFTNETTTGWQEAFFAAPVAITAGTTYVVSYHAPAGRYSVSANQFAGAGVDAPPLHAPASTATALNGLYRYGTTAVFPTTSYRASNYWVDVVFTPT